MRIYDDIWHENVWELDLRFEIYQSKGSLFQDAQLRRPHLIGRQNCRRHGWSLGAPVIAGPAIWKKGQSHTHMIPKNIPTRISIYLWHTYIYITIYIYIHCISMISPYHHFCLTPWHLGPSCFAKTSRKRKSIRARPSNWPVPWSVLREQWGGYLAMGNPWTKWSSTWENHL